MPRVKEQRLGVLVGQSSSGAEAIVTVSKVGKDFRIRWAGREHRCPSSVRDIDAVKHETLLTFQVRNVTFVAA
jgi:hypothetical protein